MNKYIIKGMNTNGYFETTWEGELKFGHFCKHYAKELLGISELEDYSWSRMLEFYGLEIDLDMKKPFAILRTDDINYFIEPVDL